MRNIVNYLLNILLRKDAINKYKITAIKDPVCLGEECVICGSIRLLDELGKVNAAHISNEHYCTYLGFKYHGISDKLVLVNNSNLK